MRFLILTKDIKKYRRAKAAAKVIVEAKVEADH